MTNFSKLWQKTDYIFCIREGDFFYRIVWGYSSPPAHWQQTASFGWEKQSQTLSPRRSHGNRDRQCVMQFLMIMMRWSYFLKEEGGGRGVKRWQRDGIVREGHDDCSVGRPYKQTKKIFNQQQTLVLGKLLGFTMLPNALRWGKVKQRRKLLSTRHAIRKTRGRESREKDSVGSLMVTSTLVEIKCPEIWKPYSYL